MLAQPTESQSLRACDYCATKACKFSGTRHGLEVRSGDLHWEITGGEQIPNGYTLLDLIFVAATSRHRRDHFADSYKVFITILQYRPRVWHLSSNCTWNLLKVIFLAIHLGNMVYTTWKYRWLATPMSRLGLSSFCPLKSTIH